MKKNVLLVAALACAAGSTSALAIDTVRARFDTIDPNVTCQFSTNWGGTWQGTLAGRMNWTRDNVNPGTHAPLQGTFSTFCIEVTQNVAFASTYEYHVVPVGKAPTDDPLFDLPMGSWKADMLSKLFGRRFNSLTTSDDFGAFQMAIWEIVYEMPGEEGMFLSLTGGRFQIQNGGTAATLAAAWLLEIDGTGPRMGGLYALTSDTAQDQIVPTPGTLALAGLGGLLCAKRRRRN